MLDEFILYIETNQSKNTARNYKCDLEKFPYELAELTAIDLLEWIDILTEAGNGRATINRKLSAVRAFAKWAALTRKIPAEVYQETQLVKGPKMESVVRLPFSAQEIEQILSRPDLNTETGNRDFALWKFLLDTGARVSEALGINIEDLRFDADGGSVVVNGKGSRERVVFFSNETAGALLRITRGRAKGPVFVNPEGKRLSSRWVQKTLQRYSEELGFDAHPHKFRRTFIVRAVDRTGDIHSVATAAGHLNIATTEGYARAATANLRKTFQAARGEGPSRPSAEQRTPVLTIDNYVKLPYTKPSEEDDSRAAGS